MTISNSNISVNRYEESIDKGQKKPQNSINSMIARDIVKKEVASASCTVSSIDKESEKSNSIDNIPTIIIEQLEEKSA